MKNSKARLWLFLLAFVLCFSFTGKQTQAASKSIAYVDVDNKALVWKALEFCSDGYTYKVINDETDKVVKTGSINAKTAAGKVRDFTISLGSDYDANSWYSLKITGENNRSYIIRYKLPGTSNLLKKISVGKTAQDGLKASATVASTFSGSALFMAYPSATSVNMVASVKLTRSTSTSMTGTIAGSKLPNNCYKTYLVLYYTHNNKIYYGPEKEASYTFLKTQYKVTGLRASWSGARVKLSWTAAKNASYYRIYRSTSLSGTYSCIKSGVTTTSCYTNALSGGKTYYFKVQAVGKAGGSIKYGEQSVAKSVKIPVLPGKVTGIKFALNMDNKLVMKWNKTSNATGYMVYYKKSTASKYKKLATTKNREYILSKLKSGTTYNIRIYSYRKSGANTILAAESSKILTINPKQYIKAHRKQLLADGVRTIGYIGTTREVYTKRHYTAERKLAFVNYKGYSSSSKYLIWISHYTQQVTIFKGSKGHWKIMKTCTVATGRACSRSPRGTYKITYKEKGWFYNSTKELYVTHWCGRNSFHTRPLWNDGSVCTATIGRPASHGCVRMYNSDARYIYNNMPKGTTVISY